MRSNYESWNLRLEEYFEKKTEKEKMLFLLRFAALAPSGHNTQPWNFSIEANEIFAWVNRDRSLQGSDPGRHVLLVAFGCMIENLAIAGAYYGYHVKIDYLPDATDPDLVARITFNVAADKPQGEGELAPWIPARVTNRGKYKMQPLPSDFLKKIESMTGDKLKIFSMTHQAERDVIADIVNDAQIEAMEDPMFREELSHFMKSSFTKEHAGMPGFALEIPAPMSILVPRLIKKINFSKQNKKKDDELLKQHTPAFLVIGSSHDDSVSRLDAGRLLEKIWLEATKQGLTCSVLAAPIQSPSHVGQLKKALKTELEPQVFLRIGYPEKEFRHSPRFLVEQLLKK